MIETILELAQELNKYPVFVQVILGLAAILVPTSGGILLYKNRKNIKMIFKSKNQSAGRDLINGAAVTVNNYGDSPSGKPAPSFHVSKRMYRNYKQIEIRNTGNEPLIDLLIIREDGTVQKNFLKITEDQLHDYPHTSETLDVNEAKLIINLPDSVKLHFSAKGAVSQQVIEKDIQFDFK